MFLIHCFTLGPLHCVKYRVDVQRKKEKNGCWLLIAELGGISEIS